MKITKAIINEFSDGFEIVLIDEDGTRHKYGFDQEDMHDRLLDMFDKLGISATYEDCY